MNHVYFDNQEEQYVLGAVADCIEKYPVSAESLCEMLPSLCSLCTLFGWIESSDIERWITNQIDKA